MTEKNQDPQDIRQKYELTDGGTKRRRGWRKLAWWVGAAVVLVALVAIPLKIHPVDTWIHRLLGHSEATATKSMSAQQTASSSKRKILFYRNPMDPTITSPVPAKDSMGMDYVPVYADEANGSKAKSGSAKVADSGVKGKKGKILFYRSPMDPTVTSPVPAKDSMGMDYVPVYANEAGASAGSSGNQPANQGAVVTIDPAVVQNMNVVTAPVEKRDLSRRIRTVGYLDYDQGKMVSVTTKYPGWIAKAYVNYLGQPVKRGEPLFTIYSPDLVQTEQELLSAIDFARRMSQAPADARRRAEQLVTAAETRLGYWDITAKQIAELEQHGKIIKNLTVYSPASGLVMMRMPGLEGMAVKPGMELMHIANLSTLWLSVEVFEDQLPWLHPGSEADISLSYFPGETFKGRVRYVEPEVSEKTRTVGLRLEVANPDGRLRAGMYATVVFTPVMAKDTIAVPSLSILRTGERNLVIVALGDGRFAPRQVVLGAEGDGYTQILSGIQAGEQVVTSSQFLIDSESNLREAIQQLIAKAAKKAAAKAPMKMEMKKKGADDAQ